MVITKQHAKAVKGVRERGRGWGRGVDQEGEWYSRRD